MQVLHRKSPRKPGQKPKISGKSGKGASRWVTELVPTQIPRRYNSAVPVVPSRDDAAIRHQRHAVYASEATGLLVIALLLLALTVVRYWHYIHWSQR